MSNEFCRLVSIIVILWSSINNIAENIFGNILILPEI